VLATLGRPSAQILHTPGQAVAHPLELRQREQTRTGAHAIRTKSLPRREHLSRWIRDRRDVRKGAGYDLRQLSLHSRDLPAQSETCPQLRIRSSAFDDSWLLGLGDHTRLLP
jgi:hypothetical protein